MIIVKSIIKHQGAYVDPVDFDVAIATQVFKIRNVYMKPLAVADVGIETLRNQRRNQWDADMRLKPLPLTNGLISNILVLCKLSI